GSTGQDDVRPLTSAVEVLQVEAGTQHPAVDDAGCEGREFPRGGTRHGFVKKLRSVDDFVQMSLGQALKSQAKCPEVSVSATAAHVINSVAQLPNRCPVTRRFGEQCRHEGVVAMNVGFGQRFDESLGLRIPAACDGEVRSSNMMDGQYERHE